MGYALAELYKRRKKLLNKENSSWPPKVNDSLALKIIRQTPLIKKKPLLTAKLIYREWFVSSYLWHIYLNVTNFE